MNMSEKHFISTIKLSLASEVPMYLQLANYFKKQIKYGKLKPKDKLISEIDIVKLLGISRTTVRLAFEYLEKQGLIIRKKGKGSYVAEPNIRTFPGCLDNMIQNIHNQSLVVLQKEILDANDTLKTNLKLPDNKTEIFFIERLILSENTPLILEKIYVPLLYCPGIENMDLNEKPFISIIQNNFSIKIEKTEEIISINTIEESVSKILKCDKGTFCYKVDYIAKSKQGTPILFKNILLKADKYKLKINSERNKYDLIDFIHL